VHRAVGCSCSMACCSSRPRTVNFSPGYSINKKGRVTWWRFPSVCPWRKVGDTVQHTWQSSRWAQCWLYFAYGRECTVPHLLYDFLAVLWTVLYIKRGGWSRHLLLCNSGTWLNWNLSNGGRTDIVGAGVWLGLALCRCDSAKCVCVCKFGRKSVTHSHSSHIPCHSSIFQPYTLP